MTTDFLSLIPLIVAFAVIIYSKNALISLFSGLIVAAVMVAFLSGDYGIIGNFSELLQHEFATETVVWVSVFSVLIGAYAMLLTESKSVDAFSLRIASIGKTQRATLFSAFIMNLVIFPDDYLKGLVLCEYGKSVNKLRKIPLKMFMFAIPVLSIPLCCITPFTTWSIFYVAIMEDNGISQQGQGLTDFMTKVVPFSVFPFVMLAIFVFVLFFKKDFEEDGLSKTEKREEGLVREENDYADNIKAKPFDFVVSILALIGGLIISDFDLCGGLTIALIFMCVWFVPRKLMSLTEFVNTTMNGMASMMTLVVYLGLGYVFTAYLNQLGFSECIEYIGDILPNQIILFAIFVVASILAMVTGMLWPITILFIPMCMPLYSVTGISPFIIAAALFSGIEFGGVTSPRGGANVTFSVSLKTDVITLINAGKPYTMIAGGITAFVYLLLGFIV